MKRSCLYCSLALLAIANLSAVGAAGIPAFYGDPPDEHHPWAVHDPNRPQPKAVTPGTFSSQELPGKPPSDAFVLFDGASLDKWQSANEGGGPAKWVVKDGTFEVAPKTGDIRTRDEFGDCQLHIEWAEPADVSGSSQGRGNSGIFLMGLVEVQVLDSYNNITYADGHASSVYGVMPPLVNAIKPPGQFQVYDIVFRRPIFQGDKMVDPGYVTVFVNGVLTQDHTPLEGATGHMGRTHPRPFPVRGPLKLQDHGNNVRFRNIWYRPLAPRPIEGGTDGYLTEEATMSKRKQIASDIRADAQHLSGVPQLLRLMESLEYEKDAPTVEKVQAAAAAYVQKLKQLPASQLASEKDQAKRLNDAFAFLLKKKILDVSFAPATQLDAIIKEQKWDKK
jgi:prepilin-type processing-associated H-X9-DG protein